MRGWRRHTHTHSETAAVDEEKLSAGIITATGVRRGNGIASGKKIKKSNNNNNPLTGLNAFSTGKLLFYFA